MKSNILCVVRKTAVCAPNFIAFCWHIDYLISQHPFEVMANHVTDHQSVQFE